MVTDYQKTMDEWAAVGNYGSSGLLLKRMY